MFYKPGEDHGLPYDPFKACVVPRPIGWISTVSPGEKPVYNLAPYSQFNNLTFDPPYVMFSANQTPVFDAPVSNGTSAAATNRSGFDRKDTVKNAEATGYFCWQLATYPLREAVNISAQNLPYGDDEFEHAGLAKEWSTILPVKIPMVAESPVKFECQVHSTLRLPGNPPMGTVDVVIGRVLGVHIDEKYISAQGKLDPALTQPIARLGYYDYTVVRDTFEMIIPNLDQRLLGGMEGSVKANRKLNTARQDGQSDQTSDETGVKAPGTTS